MYKYKSLFKVLVSYIVSLIAAGCFLVYFSEMNLIIRILYADIIATIIIYSFSYFYNNSSIYDPYWSVIPPFILSYFIYSSELYNINSLIILFSVLFWAFRLTFNWIRGWSGLNSEDWRYIDMRKYSPKFFQISNFFGIHLFPTLIVFICCIPMKYALDKPYSSLSFIIGFLLCFIGVLYEIISDHQLYQFKKKNPTGIIGLGLWKYSRHPNYYGEILFWWGLFFYGVNGINFKYLIIGPILMTIMFLYVSIPWIEDKILRTRPEYKEYQQAVNILLPELSIIKKIFKK